MELHALHTSSFTVTEESIEEALTNEKHWIKEAQSQFSLVKEIIVKIANSQDWEDVEIETDGVYTSGNDDFDSFGIEISISERGLWLALSSVVFYFKDKHDPEVVDFLRDITGIIISMTLGPGAYYTQVSDSELDSVAARFNIDIPLESSYLSQENIEKKLFAGLSKIKEQHDK